MKLTSYFIIQYILIATRTRSDLTDYDTLTAPDIWSVGASMLKIFLSHSGPYTQKHVSYRSFLWCFYGEGVAGDSGCNILPRSLMATGAMNFAFYSLMQMAFITLCNHKYFPWNKESAAVGKIKKIKLLKSVYPNWTQLWQFVEDCLQVSLNCRY